MHQMSIDGIGLSVRSCNALKRAGIRTVEEMLVLTEAQLLQMGNIGQKSAQEILTKIRELSAADRSSTESGQTAPKAGEIRRMNRETPLEETDLSVRSKNQLRRAGIHTIGALIELDEAQLSQIRNLGRVSITEILAKIPEYQNAIAQSDIPLPVETVDPYLHYEDWLADPINQSRIQEYLYAQGISVADWTPLPRKEYNALFFAGCTQLCQIIFATAEELCTIPQMTPEGAEKVVQHAHTYLINEKERLLTSLGIPDRSVEHKRIIREQILQLYQTLGFSGLHFPEIVEKLQLPEDVELVTIKKVMGQLIAEGRMEYIDYRCYRVYPTFDTGLAMLPPKYERNVRCVRQKLQGETLESIGQQEGLTRERVRQIIQRTDQRVRKMYHKETGLTLFDEDYYRYFYSTYEADFSVCTEWLALSPATYYYLDTLYDRGKKPLDDALTDPALETGLKLKIDNYLKRNKIFVDGNWIEKKRAAIEDHVLKHYCTDEISFENFAEAYNHFLAGQGIPYDEDIYYTAEIMKTRQNRISESRQVLWKQAQRLRYYDIDGRDYTELLETLNLDAYENVELSVLKFMEQYPEIMERYDIRDHYELHNLLRKIVPDGSYHDFRCGRMPTISFGNANRKKMLEELLASVSPIAQQDLIELIHAEYGYDRNTIAVTYLQDLKEYGYRGVYTMDVKELPAPHKQLLCGELTEDFYYIDEIKQKYVRMVPDADPEAINPYNLRMMGFQVLSRYALQNWPSLEAYFRHLLLQQDVMDITRIKKRLPYVMNQTLTTLKNEYEIMEFEPNQIINIRKLNQSGITKADLRAFCDWVYATMPEGTYFSGRQLRMYGTDVGLYDLGFSDWFYAKLVACDPRFSFSQMFGSVILYKGKATISIRSFLEDRIRRVGKTDIYDLMTELERDFGCKIEMKHDITTKLQGADVYFDPILERFYANQELYYRELDEDPEVM